MNALVEYTTVNGVCLHIRPVGLATRQSIIAKAADVFPYPDATPYRHEVPGAIPGVLSDPMDNPDYARLVEAVDAKRRQWTSRALVKVAVTLPDYPTPDTLTGAFTELIEATQPYVNDEPYDIALFQGVLNWDSDYAALVNLIAQNITLPLSSAEVLDGVRLFRYSLPGG